MTNGTEPKKKGLSTLAWIAIGCGGLIVVGLIGVFGLGMFAVKKGKEFVAESTGSESFDDFVADLQENPTKKLAEAMVAANPDLDLVATDDEAGTITFRNHKTGEEATLDFADIAEGRFSMRTEEGEFRMDADQAGEGGVTFSGPDGQTRIGANTDLGEVPDWVPMYPRGREVQSVYHSVTGEQVAGALTAATDDEPARVVESFKEFCEDGGWEIVNQSSSSSGGVSSASLLARSGDRSLNVNAVRQDDETQINIIYNDNP